MSTSIPKGINININKKNYPSKCYQANILEIENNPYLNINDNMLYIKVNLIYLDPKLDPCNPLNYLIISSQNLIIDATGIFSIGNLETSIESLFGLMPTEPIWSDIKKYYMYNIISYTANNITINYNSIIDSNYNLQPNIYNTIYSNAWAPYWDTNTSYIIGNCVYYPYTNIITKITTNYLYICIQNNLGNTPPSPLPTSSTSVFWQFYTWDDTISYLLNSQVTHYSKTYLSIKSPNINNEPDIYQLYWTEIWSTLLKYNIYQIVIYDESTITSLSTTYMSITSSNINQIPSLTSTYWASKWISKGFYNIGNYVYYTSNNTSLIYICIGQVNGSIIPPVIYNNDKNTYNTDWQPYIWVSDYSYKVDQIVSYYDILYISIVDSNLNKEPDINPNFWTTQYSLSKIYSITDLVYYTQSDISTIYMSVININNTPINSIYWTTSYINNIIYNIGDFVYYTDLLIYLCKNTTNGTQNPVDIIYWQPYIWNSSYIFEIDNIIYYTNLSQNYTQTDENCDVTNSSIVYYGYKPYKSLTNSNQNNTPGSLQSSYWANKWVEIIIYSINDIVYYIDELLGNLTYISLQNNNVHNIPIESDDVYWKVI